VSDHEYELGYHRGQATGPTGASLECSKEDYMKTPLPLLLVAALIAIPGCARDAATGKSPTPPAESTASKATAPAEAPKAAAPAEAPKTEPRIVALDTNLGEIVLELHPDKAPKTVENFLKLAGEGFYDGVRFHRLVPGFVIQAGDPNTKDPERKDEWGKGGPGYKFADEPVRGDYERGALAMANSGPNTNGSQFFICLANLSGRLPKAYNLFGKVIEGMEVVDKIAALPRDTRDRPETDAIIRKATVR
jgi:cyclophilin family peptidyl-prolyl cis-trans isomerase